MVIGGIKDWKSAQLPKTEKEQLFLQSRGACPENLLEHHMTQGNRDEEAVLEKKPRNKEDWTDLRETH